MAARRARHAVDLGMRWLRPRGDSDYLFSNPVDAARLNRAIEDSFTGRTHEFTVAELRARFQSTRSELGDR
jgi:hypothetical protein